MSVNFRLRFLQSICTLTPVHYMTFKLNPKAGQPLYLQVMQQIRHAVETGVLQRGDQLPGIRTLAEEIVVSHTTIAKAYSELEHAGILELRHGSGAYILGSRGIRNRSEKVRLSRERVHELVESLQEDGLSTEEIRRLFEAELLYTAQGVTRR
jgi:GntR family transcriptional regulator